MLTEGRKDKENPTMRSPSRKAYQKQLKETFNMNRTQILAFKKKPPTPIEAIPNEFSAIHQSKPTKPRPYIPQGMMVEFAKNVADIVAASGKKHIVMLSSLDFGRWQTIDMSSGLQIYYLSSANMDGTYDDCERLWWKRL